MVPSGNGTHVLIGESVRWARMSEPMSVSIVVATRDELESLGRCLRALGDQTYPCEILVADGGVDASARAIVEQYGARWLDNPDRIAATGWNRGLDAATGDVLGIMSSHAVPARDYVERCVEALHRTGAWAVGGRIARFGGSGPIQEAIARATSSPFGVGNSRHNYADEPGWAETVFPGMWPRWVLEQVGRFDAELVRNQDDELSYRIREAGGRIWYDPAIVVAYEPRASLRSVFDQYRQYGFWKVRVYAKHPGAIRPRQLVPAAWLAALTIGIVALGMRSPARLLLWPAAVGYSFFILAAGLRLGGGRMGGRIAAALAAVHSGYGLGMWQGLIASTCNRLRRTRT